MVVKDLLGNEYQFKISRKTNKKFSKLHQSALETLRIIYPAIRVCEEVPVKVRPGLTLYLDIYVPHLEMILEVHGKQHYEYIEHYHGQPHRFGRSQLNDDLKQEWCKINNFRYVELPYNESREQWAHRIRTAVGSDTR